MLQVDSNARMKANLSMLQRLDPEITDVLESATHVTMYQFDPTTSKWDRYDCEGPLFIVKRGSAPRRRPRPSCRSAAACSASDDVADGDGSCTCEPGYFGASCSGGVLRGLLLESLKLRRYMLIFHLVLL